jgi:hypothetical protein
MNIHCSRIFKYVPYGSRRDIGAGLVMTATGVLATILWFGGVYALLAVGVVSDTIGFLFISALFWVPLGLLSTFPVGILLWRFIESRPAIPYRGALFGGLTATCSLAIGSIFPSLFNPVLDAFAGEMELSVAIVQSIVRLPRSFGMAFTVAGWIIIPLGTITGWCYEQSG